MKDNKFGEFLCELRKELNLTQADFGRLVKVTDKAVSKWESGNGMPDIAMFPQLAEILGVTTDELFKGERNKNREVEKPLSLYEALVKSPVSEVNQFLEQGNTLSGYDHLGRTFVDCIVKYRSYEWLIWAIHNDFILCSNTSYSGMKRMLYENVPFIAIQPMTISNLSRGIPFRGSRPIHQNKIRFSFKLGGQPLTSADGTKVTVINEPLPIKETIEGASIDQVSPQITPPPPPHTIKPEIGLLSRLKHSTDVVRLREGNIPHKIEIFWMIISILIEHKQFEIVNYLIKVPENYQASATIMDQLIVPFSHLAKLNDLDNDIADYLFNHFFATWLYVLGKSGNKYLMEYLDYKPIPQNIVMGSDTLEKLYLLQLPEINRLIINDNNMNRIESIMKLFPKYELIKRSHLPMRPSLDIARYLSEILPNISGMDGFNIYQLDFTTLVNNKKTNAIIEYVTCARNIHHELVSLIDQLIYNKLGGSRAETSLINDKLYKLIDDYFEFTPFLYGYVEVDPEDGTSERFVTETEKQYNLRIEKSIQLKKYFEDFVDDNILEAKILISSKNRNESHDIILKRFILTRFRPKFMMLSDSKGYDINDFELMKGIIQHLTLDTLHRILSTMKLSNIEVIKSILEHGGRFLAIRNLDNVPFEYEFEQYVPHKSRSSSTNSIAFDDALTTLTCLNLRVNHSAKIK